MNDSQVSPMQPVSVPILLFDDQCGVCRRIGHWVQQSGESQSGQPSIVTRPIGDDAEALRSLHPDLDIWDAYATIHVLMPDGSMKLGGEAVAAVLQALHNSRWFAWIFAISIFGFRPFQALLNLAYAILAAVRPLFGCESCGTLTFWMRPLRWIVKRVEVTMGKGHHQNPPRTFGARGAPRPLPSSDKSPL
jgi:hypothetical protein